METTNNMYDIHSQRNFQSRLQANPEIPQTKGMKIRDKAHLVTRKEQTHDNRPLKATSEQQELH